MKTKNLKKRISLTLIMAIAVSCFCGINAFAFVNGYNSATELGTSAITAYLESASQNDWYKFTLTEAEVPVGCGINLNQASSCIYNFDLRYREASSRNRPAIVSNETIASGSGQKQMRLILTKPGTYFVRVYSQNGTYSNTNSYRIKNNLYTNSNMTLTLGTSFPSATLADWSVCAGFAGNVMYNNMFKSSTSSRNYKNAYTFIKSNYTSDSESDYDNTEKATPEQVAIAADYIYGGDILENPRFEVATNEIYTIAEIAKFVWQYEQPVILYIDNDQVSSIEYLKSLRKYVIISEVNLPQNTITYYNCDSGADVIVDYDDFLTNGIDYGDNMVTRFRGTSIVPANYRQRIQAAYN